MCVPNGPSAWYSANTSLLLVVNCLLAPALAHMLRIRRYTIIFTEIITPSFTKATIRDGLFRVGE